MLIKDQPHYFMDILWALLLSSPICNSHSTKVYMGAQDQALQSQLSARSGQLQANFFPNQSKTNKQKTNRATNTQQDSTWYSPTLSIRLRTNSHVFWLLSYGQIFFLLASLIFKLLFSAYRKTHSFIQQMIFKCLVSPRHSSHVLGNESTGWVRDR